MFNPYAIILISFTLAGFVAAVWGWRVLQQSKKAKAWPKATAEITRSELPTSQFEDFAPLVTFRYQVNSRNYDTQQNFPNASFSQEFCRQFVSKYPVGAQVDVFYDPKNPERATLEPGAEKGDWLIFAIGVLATLFGFLMLSV